MSLSKPLSISEDWVVVILGLVIIFLALSGIVVPKPSFSWTNTTELSEKVIATKNLSAVGYQFILIFSAAVLGATLLGKNVKTLLFVLPVVYLLTLFALILAGNSVVKSYNLEAVIFTLGIGLLISNFFRLPQWFRDALSTELYVKIGLILLGTTVIFG